MLMYNIIIRQTLWNAVVFITQGHIVFLMHVSNRKYILSRTFGQVRASFIFTFAFDLVSVFIDVADIIIA